MIVSQYLLSGVKILYTGAFSIASKRDFDESSFWYIVLLSFAVECRKTWEKLIGQLNHIRTIHISGRTIGSTEFRADLKFD
jgi:hypothetical protein